MKLPEDYDEQPGMSMPVMSAIVAVVIFIALILVLVIVWNLKDSGRGAQPSAQQSVEGEEQNTAGQEYPDTDQLISGSSLSPDDLDFWDQYPEETETEETTEEESTEESDEEDIWSDGYHTLVTNRFGEEEWVAINSSLNTNNYELTNLIRYGNMMKYFVNEKQASYVGVTISEDSRDVDFEALKEEGVDYCMIRVGARGYSSGKLETDEKFKEHIEGATEAGLDVGVYFYSQAITTAEAQAEAALVLQNLQGYDIEYPVAFDMEYVLNDDSRIEALSKNDKTKIAQTFLKDIKTAGYQPILYGNKAWLLQEINLVKLQEYDVWLGEPGELPDYPYEFTMWQYSDSAQLEGIKGYTNMSISFIDYSKK